MALKKKIKGSAILETSIAMVIIATCIALSFSFISKITKNDNSAIKSKAERAILNEINSSNRIYENYSKSFDEFELTCEVVSSNLADDLLIITYSAEDINGNTIMSTKELKSIDLNEKN